MWRELSWGRMRIVLWSVLCQGRFSFDFQVEMKADDTWLEKDAGCIGI